MTLLRTLVLQSRNGTTHLLNHRKHPQLLSRRLFANLVNFNLADIGEGIHEVEILQWFVKPGDLVKEFDRICEVQSDKANVEISSRYSGKISSLQYAEGEIARVGQPLLKISVEGAHP